MKSPPRTHGRLWIPGAIAFVLLLLGAGAVWIALDPTWEATIARTFFRGDCPECTAHLRLLVDGWAESHDGVYPVSEAGEIAALSRFPDHPIMAGFLATGGSRGELTRRFEEVGSLSADLCLYRYVQGLRPRDPAHLVLLYSKAPTRWRVHLQYTRERRWIVLGPVSGSGEESHGAEWVETEVLRDRLEATLRFLREKRRPQWEATVRAHQEFLDGLR